MSKEPSNKVLDAVLSEVRGKKPKELEETEVLAILSCGTNFMTMYCLLQTHGRDLANVGKYSNSPDMVDVIMDALYTRYIQLWWEMDDVLEALDGRVEVVVNGDFLECHFLEGAR